MTMAPLPEPNQEGASEQDYIVATKLRVPHAPPDVVLRSRLIEQINQGLRRKLVLVSAPAGSGKTTLLSTWCEASAGARLPISWISLDEQDNDPERFWSYVAATLRMGRSSSDEDADPPPQSARPLHVESLLAGIINEVVRRSERFILVLDDYHAITSPTIHKGMAFLLKYLPLETHIVISGRTDPPLPLATLRAEGQLYELRASDLRFSPEEVSRFARYSLDLSLPGQIMALEASTEGWAAGLRLGTLALQAGGGLPAVQSAISGEHRYVFDYLAHEVLRKQPLEVQRFLVSTSILDNLSASLCDAVTGMNNGRAMLEHLDGANLFLVPLDDERRWYRYHRLFAEFLRAELANGPAAQSAVLQSRASAWFERHNMPAEAIRHALAAGDFNRAGSLIGRAAEARVQRGEVATLLTWLNALPAQLVRASPGLCMWYAWVLFLRGDLRHVENYLRHAELKLKDAPDARMDGRGAFDIPKDCLPVADMDQALGQIAVIRSSMAHASGDMPGTIRYAQKALHLIQNEGKDNLTLRSISLLNLGSAHVAQGDLASAAQEFREAQQISRATGDLYNAFGATDLLADLFILRGDLPRAEDLYRQALEFSGAGKAKAVPAVDMLFVGLGDLQYERNSLDEAVECLLKGIEACEVGGSFSTLLRGYVTLARAKLALGDTEEAQERLERAERIAQREGSAPEIDHVKARQARVWLSLGDLVPAERWAEEYEPLQRRYVSAASRSIHYLQDLVHSTRLRVSLARGCTSKDQELLSRLQQEAEATGRCGSLAEFLMLEALCLQSQGKRGVAVDRLGRALSIAGPGGFVRLFLDEGQPMFELLSMTLDMQLRQPHHSSNAAAVQSLEYIHHLLAAFRADMARKGVSPAPPVDPPLTARELQVLQLLVGKLPYKDIAAALVITEDTAKWHIKNIYRKLKVSGRAHLIQRVGELDLLS